MLINACPTDNLNQICNNASPHDVIVLDSGLYRQKVEITTSHLTLVGQGADKTVISFDDCANKIHTDGKQFNTFRTYTVAVCADNVRLQNLTVQNTTVDPKTNGQCVALSIVGDNFEMSNCHLRSTQDTLFCGPLPDDLIERYDGFLHDKLRRVVESARQTFCDCEIRGSVDFVFGCGQAVFNNCTIVSVNDGRQIGYVAAPAHARQIQQGFEFVNCNFVSTNDVAPQSVFLARPWRDFGRCHFVDCTFGKHINPLGFDKWNDTNRDKTARFSVKNCTTLANLVEWVTSL